MKKTTEEQQKIIFRFMDAERKLCDTEQEMEDIRSEFKEKFWEELDHFYN